MVCTPLEITFEGGVGAIADIEYWYKWELNDWAKPTFILLAAVAGAAIPVSATLRMRKGSRPDWFHHLRLSVVVTATAFPWSILLSWITYALVKKSWEYHHDGVPECFFLAIPIVTTLAILLSAILARDHVA